MFNIRMKSGEHCFMGEGMLKTKELNTTKILLIRHKLDSVCWLLSQRTFLAFGSQCGVHHKTELVSKLLLLPKQLTLIPQRESLHAKNCMKVLIRLLLLHIYQLS